MRVLFPAAVAVLALTGVTGAMAQVSNSFRGVYVEGQAGGDRFQSEGRHKDKFGYGAAMGFDGVIADKWVVGPQFGYWRGKGENTTAINGGLINHKSFEEYSAGVRGGFLVTPKLLTYATGGFARNEQRQAFTGVNGTAVGLAYDHGHTDGYYVGGGAEYSLTDMFFVGAEYRYANYDNHTARQRLFATAGVRFK